MENTLSPHKNSATEEKCAHATASKEKEVERNCKRIAKSESNVKNETAILWWLWNNKKRKRVSWNIVKTLPAIAIATKNKQKFLGGNAVTYLSMADKFKNFFVTLFRPISVPIYWYVVQSLSFPFFLSLLFLGNVQKKCSTPTQIESTLFHDLIS